MAGNGQKQSIADPKIFWNVIIQSKRDFILVPAII
jgi:hypothetical protein